MIDARPQAPSWSWVDDARSATINTIRRLGHFARAFVHDMPAGMQVGAALLVVLASLTEGVGLALLVPLIALIGDTAASHGRVASFAARVLGGFGLPLSLPVLI